MSQRFSDAELAAEYWYAKARASSIEANGYSPHYHLADAETFHRFATLPHAQDEPGAYVFQCKNCPASWETDDEQRLKIFARNHQYLSHDYWKENQ